MTFAIEPCHRTIIVTKSGEFLLDLKYSNAQDIVDQDMWGQRYYALDNNTAMIIELEYEREQVGTVVNHMWKYAQSVTAEAEYKPAEMTPIEDIPDSEDKSEPSYFAALMQEVTEYQGYYVKRGDVFASYTQFVAQVEQEAA